MKLRGFVFGLIAVAMSLFVGCTKPEKTEAVKEQPKQEVNELPYLDFVDLTAGRTSTRALPGNSVIILFNTDCDHCQHEAEEINNKADVFKNYQLYFIAADSIHIIQKFSEKYGLADNANVHFGRAEYNDVFTNFGSVPTPAIYIYSRERKLVKSFLGQTQIEEIQKFL